MEQDLQPKKESKQLPKSRESLSQLPYKRGYKESRYDKGYKKNARSLIHG